jgi:LAO/AO transport system kinase
VVTCSALNGDGINQIWETVLQHSEKMQASGWFLRHRRQQALDWMHELISSGLEAEFYKNPGVRSRLPVLEGAVRASHATSYSAARELLALFRSRSEVPAQSAGQE